MHYDTVLAHRHTHTEPHQQLLTNTVIAIAKSQVCRSRSLVGRLHGRWTRTRLANQVKCHVATSDVAAECLTGSETPQRPLRIVMDHKFGKA